MSPAMQIDLDPNAEAQSVSKHGLDAVFAVLELAGEYVLQRELEQSDSLPDQPDHEGEQWQQATHIIGK